MFYDMRCYNEYQEHEDDPKCSWVLLKKDGNFYKHICFKGFSEENFLANLDDLKKTFLRSDGYEFEIETEGFAK